MNTIQRLKNSKKVTIVGAIVNFLLAIIKIVIGFIGNSGALIADGMHSLSDLLSDFIVWYAIKHASEKPDEEHPYGHERFETVAALGLSTILIIVGIGIIFDSIIRLYNPKLLSNSILLISVAVVSILFKEVMYRYTLKSGKKLESEILLVNAWHHRTDALSSIVVLIGIVGAINGYIYLDAIAATFIGIIIIYVAVKIGIKAIKELVDTSIESVKVKKLKNALSKINGVNNIHSLRTRKQGHKISCDVHVQVDPFLSVSEGHMISVSVENIAKECLPNINDVTVHIDPEDDETTSFYKDLPERSKALDILNKALVASNYNIDIKRIQLHYLGGKIHVDFYFALNNLKTSINSAQILKNIKKIISRLTYFGEVRIYFITH